MIEYIPGTAERAFLYFHSAGRSSDELKPFLSRLLQCLPNTYIWAGDGVISNSPLMRHDLEYDPDAARHYWFTFPMQDAASQQSFLNNREAMGATLACAGAYVNAIVDSIKSRFALTTNQIILSGFAHGSCVALSAAMVRKKDPYKCVVLFNPFILEGYYLEDESLPNSTTVFCIDTEDNRKRANIETAREFQKYGMRTEGVICKRGDLENLHSEMIEEALTFISKLSHA